MIILDQFLSVLWYTGDLVFKHFTYGLHILYDELRSGLPFHMVMLCPHLYIQWQFEIFQNMRMQDGVPNLDILWRTYHREDSCAVQLLLAQPDVFHRNVVFFFKCVHQGLRIIKNFYPEKPH